MLWVHNGWAAAVVPDGANDEAACEDATDGSAEMIELREAEAAVE